MIWNIKSIREGFYLKDINIKSISNEPKSTVLSSLRKILGAQFLDAGVCIVCDRLTPRSSLFLHQIVS